MTWMTSSGALRFVLLLCCIVDLVGVIVLCVVIGIVFGKMFAVSTMVRHVR